MFPCLMGPKLQQRCKQDSPPPPRNPESWKEEEVTFGDCYCAPCHLLPCFHFHPSPHLGRLVNVNSSPFVPGFENMVQICASGIKCAPRTQNPSFGLPTLPQKTWNCELTDVSLPCNTPSLAHKMMQNSFSRGDHLPSSLQSQCLVHWLAHMWALRSLSKGVVGVCTLCTLQLVVSDYETHKGEHLFHFLGRSCAVFSALAPRSKGKWLPWQSIFSFIKREDHLYLDVPCPSAYW